MIEDEYLWGWDPTPGIVSVWADGDGRATVWRRLVDTGELVRDEVQFRPWLVLDRLDDLTHLGDRLGVEGAAGATVTYRELRGPGALRFVVRARQLATLTSAVIEGASRRLGRPIGHVRELGDPAVLILSPEEQYLVASGRTYFRGLAFDDVRRFQLDLETTGLDPQTDRIFLIAVRDSTRPAEVLEADGEDARAEADLIARLIARIRAVDPDVIENHNLHGFDLRFLEVRARVLGVPLALGRIGPPGLRQRAARRGGGPDRRVRYVVPGRELIDTMDAVLRHDFASRDLPGHGLKAVARHFGVDVPGREELPGAAVHAVYRTDPDRVRRYARADVDEVAGLSRVLGGAAFALATMVPRRYERLSDAGPATGVLDPLMARAYLHAGHALPAHQPSDGTVHDGAGLHLFAAGVAHRVVKADVASLYPSLMRAYRIGPARDRLGAMLALVDRLLDRRLAAKASAREAAPGSRERHTHDAMSTAMKLVINSAYGYLGAGGLTRFADVDAANEVTRRGREVLDLICRELAARGGTLIEADTDGVYVAVPESWSEADERQMVADVDALLPPLIRLEFDGRYAAMLSHEPKNYALLRHDGVVILRGVAFRSSRAEPFGLAFLRTAVGRLLAGDVPGVRAAYLDAITALRRRRLPTADVSSRVRLTKTPAEYLAARASRREPVYEAVLAAGRTTWTTGEHARIYRTRAGVGALVEDADVPDAAVATRDYDVDHYERVLHDGFAVRLARAFTPDDFAAVFADPDQLSLFAPALDSIRPALTRI